MSASRRHRRLAALAVGLILLGSARGAAQAGEQGFAELARAIVRHSGEDERVRIGLGRFVRLPEGIEDPLAYEFQHELARALAAIDRVVLVTPAEFAHRPLEGSGAALDFVVAGTVLAGDNGYRLLVDVEQVSAGRLFKEAVWIEANPALAAIDRDIANRAASLRTIQEVDEFVDTMRQDFELALLVGGDGRHSYQVGERIEYYLRSERDAYVAVICHQHNGVSFPLLPNLLEEEMFFPAGEVTPLSRGGAFDIVATTPGIDVIQAIACERRAPIDGLIETFGGRFDGSAETPFLSPMDRAGLFENWDRVLRNEAGDRCASRAIRILVSEPPVASEVDATRRLTIWVEGLGREQQTALAATLNETLGVIAVGDETLSEALWSLELTTRLSVPQLEELIAARLPSGLQLRESSASGLRFGPPSSAGRAGILWLLSAVVFGALRWLTG